MSEKSIGNAHDDASEAKKAPNHSASQPQKGFWSCKTICPRYNSGESELKKEIPVKVTQEKSVAGKQPSANPTDFSFSRPSKKFISKDRRICDVCGAAVSRKGLEQHLRTAHRSEWLVYLRKQHDLKMAKQEKIDSGVMTGRLWLKRKCKGPSAANVPSSLSWTTKNLGGNLNPTRYSSRSEGCGGGFESNRSRH